MQTSLFLENIGIEALAHYIPDKKMSVDEVSCGSQYSSNDIFEKIGMLEKRIAQSEHPSEMAVFAAKKLLCKTKVSLSEIGFVIYASNGVFDYQFWSPAAKVQAEIGAKEAFAFDLNNGCVSPLTALFVGSKLMSSSDYEYGLIVVSDALAKFVNYSDQHSFPFFSFGDGACAILLKKNSSKNRLISAALMTDGDYVDLNKIVVGGTRSNVSTNNSFICVDANNSKIEKLVSHDLVINYLAVIRKSLELADISINKVKYFLFNQVSQRVMSEIITELDISSDQLYSTRKYFGHMTIDSFFALEICEFEGKIYPGDYVVLAGFGVGFHWHACVIRA